MKNFILQKEIIWRLNFDNFDNFSNITYPSVKKELSRKNKFFEENFKIVFKEATLNDFNILFWPLYEEQIASKKKYLLDKLKIKTRIIDDISKPKEEGRIYNFVFLFDKKENFKGGAFFLLTEKFLSVCFRVFRRNEIGGLGKISLDFWVEKFFLEFCKEKKLSYLLHGTDIYPRYGNNIGTALFKLKAGVKPKVPKLNHFDQKFSEQFFIDKNEPVLFFTNPNQEQFYQDCYLYYPKNSLHESYINEFKKVLEWAKMNFNPREY